MDQQTVQEVLAGALTKVIGALQKTPGSRISVGNTSGNRVSVGNTPGTSGINVDTDHSGSDDSLADFQQPEKKKRCSARPTTFQLPSHLEKRMSGKKGKRNKPRGTQRMYTYDRDIICLPKSVLGKDGLVRIPRKKSMRDYLAMNKLIGKIRLTSDMSEGAIFREIRSVFEGPMDCDPNFSFKILQTCGGGSKTLSAPVLSSSFKWTAGAVAGRNSKVPVYVLAEDDLVVSDDLPSSDDDGDWKIAERSRSPSLPKIEFKSKANDDVVVIKEEKARSSASSSAAPTVTTPAAARVSSTKATRSTRPVPMEQWDSYVYEWEPSVYEDYISLLSDDESKSPTESPVPVHSPSPPPHSPISQNEITENYAEQVSKAIKDQRIKYLPVNKEQYTRIVIRRRHLWDDAMTHIKCLDERKHIRVTFIGEPAVDEGGPLREFFHLLTAEVAKKNMIFTGDEYRRVPRHSVTELENRTYYSVGKILALSLMHGGPAPRFLAHTVVDYIVYGMAQARPFDVPDEVIQNSLMKLQDVSSVEEMRTLLDSEEFDFRYEIGVAQPSQSLSLRDSIRIVKSCAAHFTIHSIKAELDQLCEGLNCMGVLQLIRENPALLRPLFLPLPPAPLTADYMINLFTTKFSPPGSNSREEEEAAVMKWVQFLQAIEDNNGNIKAVSHEDEEVEMTIKYEMILFFTTGAPCEPPLKFDPTPSVSFQYRSPYPSSNTCSNTLYLPVDEMPFEKFLYYMASGITNTAGFGLI